MHEHCREKSQTEINCEYCGKTLPDMSRVDPTVRQRIKEAAEFARTGH